MLLSAAKSRLGCAPKAECEAVMADLPNDVPSHVRAAAKIVDDHLRNVASILNNNTSTPQPRPETAAEKFRRQRLAQDEKGNSNAK
jgi:hypothetical protein